MGKIYMGGYFSPYVGAEIGYVDMGDADFAGGRTSAHGVNLSLVARAPVSERFSIFGKLGTTYGRTRVSALPGTGVATGSESGWGPAYGLGASWDISRNWSAVLEWERTRFRFAGGDREGVSATSLGVRYNF
jgi:opacity protein-like surface antigen